MADAVELCAGLLGESGAKVFVHHHAHRSGIGDGDRGGGKARAGGESQSSGGRAAQGHGEASGSEWVSIYLKEHNEWICLVEHNACQPGGQGAGAMIPGRAITFSRALMRL